MLLENKIICYQHVEIENDFKFDFAFKCRVRARLLFVMLSERACTFENVFIHTRISRMLHVFLPTFNCIKVATLMTNEMNLLFRKKI